GGVVHCIELAEALTRQGHDVTLLAPARRGQVLFRTTHCTVRLIEDDGVHDSSLLDLVQQRIALFERYLSQPGHADYDVFHVHDGIGANALLNLRKRGLIPHYVRTVHHLDHYGNVDVDALEHRSIVSADAVLTVSPSWNEELQARLGVQAISVSNGVDLQRFSPQVGARDEALRLRLGLGKGSRNGESTAPIFLCVGGIEARKNTLAALEAFARVRHDLHDAQLVIAGGASLLDHSTYRVLFDAAAARHDLDIAPGGPVMVTGVLDDEDMAALYRLADCLVFPSIIEGFGLAIIEAMASGTPTIVSKMRPFTDFLGARDCIWVNQEDAEAIAQGMCHALMPGRRDALIANGHAVAARFDWDRSAEEHIHVYRGLTHRAHSNKEFIHA
ncbi:MAG TPA: MSMEG_0565 family glycosyltransferase, partial [Rhodocyclaceae bacterium]|nr:MSMEG_0565 family glycosyltransferase [Rhodocyclaceae bacterium]